MFVRERQVQKARTTLAGFLQVALRNAYVGIKDIILIIVESFAMSQVWNVVQL